MRHALDVCLCTWLGSNFGLDLPIIGKTTMGNHPRSLERSKFESVLIGSRGVLIHNVRSAFRTEVSALDLATEWLINSAPKLIRDV